MGIGVIIGMATLTVGSAITQGILGSTGKMTEAGYVDLATKSLLVVTCVTLFAKAIKAIATLG